MTREVKAWWESSADEFQETGDRSVGIDWGWDGIEDRELLGDVAGADLVEVGCGGGQCTVALAEYGADVVGVDLSEGQLGHARAAIADAGVDAEVVQGDVRALPLATDGFDLAFNTFVFQWVDDLGACFAEVDRVLRPGGRFVFSMPHPAFRTVDPGTHVVERSYFDTGRWVRYEDADEHGNDLVVYHHTVADVYRELSSAGFAVDRLLEPGSPDPDDYEDGPWGDSPAELQAKVPTVLIVEARADASTGET